MASKNYAFIDGNNLYLGTKAQDINLDYGKLRKYLRNKFDVEKDSSLSDMTPAILCFIQLYKPMVIY